MSWHAQGQGEHISPEWVCEETRNCLLISNACRSVPLLSELSLFTALPEALRRKPPKVDEMGLDQAVDYIAKIFSSTPMGQGSFSSPRGGGSKGYGSLSGSLRSSHGGMGQGQKGSGGGGVGLPGGLYGAALLRALLMLSFGESVRAKKLLKFADAYKTAHSVSLSLHLMMGALCTAMHLHKLANASYSDIDAAP